ncbi:DEAD/DEAH box helicase [Corallococcus sp. AS-1-6]|uniref:DEAD/DEAH box helicase n=1 Tax=Corallococcus sp. AS-1-6 TaxID=2874599 RepID=UPI001CBB098A|nr:DEAD/DEAH box helicase [Corallococcus sp. AS-1-6]MBZ4372325.1 DEAD/DEAH box helicase [Corallococcus sp. AS-1-6]
MDVFALRDSVIGEYERFATSFTTIRAADLRTKLKAFYAAGTYWPEPLIQLNPHYQEGRTQAELVKGDVLHPKCPDLFRSTAGHPLPLHKHQELAAILATTGASYVVTTGTGSGKSLCFFVPIVSAVLKERDAGAPRRTRAIIIYPMNALANSQLEELEKYLGKSGDAPVTYARYTGTEKQQEREAIARNPPDILLTNFMMLELLMTRQDPVDRQVMANCEGLRFLVLDELHTYRGRQGADVALLVRRVRERLAPQGLQCIGTSATMASADSLQQGRSTSSVVSRVASQLFGAQVPETHVITEWLRRQTTGPHQVAALMPSLAKALEQPLARDVRDSVLTSHPLSIWVETRLGITVNPDDQTWRRARPLSVSAAVQLLAQESGCPESLCRERLRHFLLLSSQPEKDRRGDKTGATNPFFAFKLHQFISGASNAYATLEPPGARAVTVDAQKFLPGAEQKRLYAVHFCRQCGHEYHPVKLKTDGLALEFIDRSIDDAPPGRDDDEEEETSAAENEEGERFGFLTRDATEDPEWDFKGKDETYPESWLDGKNALKASRRHRRLELHRVTPTGKTGSEGQPMWFLPGRFGFCVVCKEVHGGTSRDRTRLASLTAEGRSSATTVLTLSSLRWMHGAGSGLDVFTRKMLGFSDNRQDAALQAGHFNDFLFVCILRAGFLGALAAAGEKGLSSAELGEAQQRALGFHRLDDRGLRGEWMKDPEAKPFARLSAEKSLREVLAYRVWFDQRRGWRYTNPNLEQLRLVEVEYEHLDEIVSDESAFAHAPALLREATPDVRRGVYRVLFDHMRQWMAVESSVLNATSVEQLRANAFSQLRTPWAFGSDEKTRPSRWLMVSAPSRKGLTMRDEDLVVRGGSRSALGKALRSSRHWGGDARARTQSAADLEQIIQVLLVAARGLVIEEPTPFDGHMGWRLKDAHVRFKLGSGEDPERPDRINRFFRDLYRSLAKLLASPSHPLFGFEAREHTAQVEDARRIIREKRFRYGDKERQELAADAVTLAQLDEPKEFLPVLFCSPTMELGVDISQLNTVYLRNVPPTPANYAQRSGRAGRSGQAALVLTYCAAQSPHDQYFFRDPPGMVHGVVRPPMLELANQDLVESHLHAIWLANTARPLDDSIAKLVRLEQRPEWPLQADLTQALSAPEVTARSAEAMTRFLSMLEDELTPEAAPWFDGIEALARRTASNAFKRFDEAFRRWRGLYEAAHLQKEESRRVIDAHTSRATERRAAERRHGEAVNQLNLLDQGTDSGRSDFYTYRYLATEGFLPGYNFPRLPLMAYVPATEDGRGRQTYLQRPRFLALSEFGPRSLIYHEGRAYRVVRALLSLSHPTGGADARLPTLSVRLCRGCGAGHFSVDPSVCHACRQPLGDALHVREVFRIDNVGTKRAERITANDEERQRQGFDLQTTFAWADREGRPDVREGVARHASGGLLWLTYGPSATITRLNLGLRRRARRSEHGFTIDPVSGDWEKGGDEEKDGNDVGNPRQRIVPMVQDRKNALLVRPAAALDERSMATLQYALLRGLQAHFQLEEAEVLGEPMPNRDDRRGIFFYEATEGGAGVLTQVLAQPEALAVVARRALEVMHFDLEQGVPAAAAELKDKAGTHCVAACYRCLMSYYNQPDHEQIDRRDVPVRELLLRLARGVTELREPIPVTPAELLGGGPRVRFLHRLDRKGLPRPEATDWEGADFVWKQDRVVVCLGAPAPSLLERFDALSLTSLVFGDEEQEWAGRFVELSKALGKG